ncbi:MAG: Ig-like domain-containing protein [Nitrososphaeraceae archaeon]|nr:Ig-like domain-containing protein [Nitrososphaeraceae archaeon]
MNVLLLTIFLLIVPDLTYSSVVAQSDRSFAGNAAPFVPPSTSERLGSLSIGGFEFDDDGQGEDDSLDKDPLPLLTQDEINDFLSDDFDFEQNRSNLLATKRSAGDPISNVVEEIVKNWTIIKDEEDVSDFDFESNIKFKNKDPEQILQDLELILQAQELAPESENQTIATVNATEDLQALLNATEDDFEVEQDDEISAAETPDTQVLDFINQTKDIMESSVPTVNETTITEEPIVGEEQPLVPTVNETTITEEPIVGEEQPLVPTVNETTITEEPIVGEEQPSDDIQTEEAPDEEVEAQEAPNVQPTAQDVSVTTSQNQQIDIKLNANDADGDKLAFTIVDDPSDGKLGTIDPSTNTVTYTPDDDFSGKDSFKFIANDGDTDSNEATVSITVNEATDEEDEDQD